MNIKYITLLLLLCLFQTWTLNGQDNHEEEDLELKIASLPYYSFGKGVGITSPDSIYKLNIRFRMQNRATFLQEESYNNEAEQSIDGQIRRLRLRFDGYVGNPKITYALQLSFSPGDVGSLHDGDNINIIRDAVVFYSPNNHWTIGMGQTKLPGNRQRLNSSGALQLTDRSINNARFNIDRDFGIQVQHLNMYENKFSYNFKTAISMGEGRNVTSNDDLGLAYTGKVEMYPLGAFKKGGEYFEGDLMREPDPKIMLSAAFQYNDNAKQSMGQRGSILLEKKDITSFFADFVYKQNGLALLLAYMNRNAKTPLTVTSEGESYVYNGQGYDVQLSYLLKSDFDIIGRFSNQFIDKELVDYIKDTKQISFGVTKYVREHSFKIQSELTYEMKESSLLLPEGNELYFRFQVEIGI